MTIDLAVLRDRLRAELPQLTYEMVELMHPETRAQHPALSIESSERVKDHVYRMTIAVIDDQVNFFVHIHGASKDFTTQGTQRYRKACVDLEEVLVIVRSCWMGGVSS